MRARGAPLPTPYFAAPPYPPPHVERDQLTFIASAESLVLPWRASEPDERVAGGGSEPVGCTARHHHRRLDVGSVHRGVPAPGRLGYRRLRALACGTGRPGRRHYQPPRVAGGTGKERSRDARTRH